MSQQALKELVHTHTIPSPHARYIRRPTCYDLLISRDISQSHHFGYFKMDHDRLSLRKLPVIFLDLTGHYTTSVADAPHPFLLYIC